MALPGPEDDRGKQQSGGGDLSQQHLPYGGLDLGAELIGHGDQGGIQVEAGHGGFPAGTDGLDNRFGLFGLDSRCFQGVGGFEGVEVGMQAWFPFPTLLREADGLPIADERRGPLPDPPHDGQQSCGDSDEGPQL